MTRTMDTAAEYRAAAAAARKRSADSFDRCDTDGFLSQWAGDMTAREYDAKADLMDNGGKVQTSALFNLDGTVASTHEGYGQYGAYWVLNDDAAARFGKRFVSLSKARKAARRNAANAAKGFTLGTVEVEGYVTIVGSGTGLSGCMSARVATLPSVDALRAGEYTIVSTNDDTDDM